MGLVKKIQQYISKRQTAALEQNSLVVGSMNAGISTYYTMPVEMVPKTDENDLKTEKIHTLCIGTDRCGKAWSLGFEFYKHIHE